MFDVSGSEFLLVVVVAVLVIGPKDMPVALRIAGRFIGKMRRMSNHFKSGIETMIREAEMEEMEKKWQEQNRKVMEQHPAIELTAANGGGVEMVPLPPPEDPSGEAELALQAEVAAEAAPDEPEPKPRARKKPAEKDAG
ncbi:MAG: Sec-independent protein translocase protein TatB [Candidatus Andeanibacterium colombiense]|uniref:Sec-independent protein translocase protein TatB n=1 Tax=Candidatus Andeanibacterium colombiense TaxID=3121345 RepID=A0AAJ6BPK2_9SPHN|nr:MAG: Sec-independent protein translocase protein TatB [Sphingomonadaceae bacterium]